MGDLESTRVAVVEHLEDIKALFKPGAKISVFVRFPCLPDRDFILTDDALSEVIRMIGRRDPQAVSDAQDDAGGA